MLPSFKSSQVRKVQIHDTSEFSAHSILNLLISGNLLDAHDFGAMIKDAEVAVACGEHQNVLQMIGMCEENDSIFFVLEEGVKTLKQVLLDSRALIHFQAFALKNQTVSSLREAEIFAHLIAIAKGMQHLSNLKVCVRILGGSKTFFLSFQMMDAHYKVYLYPTLLSLSTLHNLMQKGVKNFSFFDLFAFGPASVVVRIRYFQKPDASVWSDRP